MMKTITCLAVLSLNLLGLPTVAVADESNYVFKHFLTDENGKPMIVDPNFENPPQSQVSETKEVTSVSNPEPVQEITTVEPELNDERQDRRGAMRAE